jgi:uridylate kinase
VKYESISYAEVIEKELRVMDATAVTLCKENHIPIIVFKLLERGNLKRLVMGESIGTVVHEEADD